MARTFRLLPGFALALSALLAIATPALAVPEGQVKRHALSLLGEPKMPADYKHFDWTNPDAPKGGTFRRFVFGTFDSLNPILLKGQAAAGIGDVFDTLMAPSPDEPSTAYGLIAEWASHPEDYSSVTFKIRDGAKFHDGKPVTPEDVIFSMEALKAANERARFYYKNVVKAEKTAENEVTFTFDTKGNRELPFIVGEITVLPKHYWEQKTASGEPFYMTTTLDAPLGSGAYKVKSVKAGASLVLERVKDYWADKLPVGLGQHNFDELVYVFGRDDTGPFEEFKAGKFDLWVENTAADWATQYNFPAIQKGLVKKELIPHKRVAGMQGFAFNTRRKQFQDSRVRQAFGLAFNFEAANKTRFYGSYTRTKSYWDNSELASSGLPEGRELEILKAVEAGVPKEVFTTPFAPPSYSSDADHRKAMGEANKLLQEAGWKRDGSVLKNAQGESLDAEFLLVQPAFEYVVLPYIADLKKLGVNATTRTVDTSQYTRRVEQFDFDIVVESFGQSHSPGNEQRDNWGSAAADKSGSNNTIGIKNPAIDKLIDNVIFATDRAELVAATRALDRVLLWNHYIVPNWHFPSERIAVWDKFGRPSVLPAQMPVATSAWWIDAEKEKALNAAMSQ